MAKRLTTAGQMERTGEFGQTHQHRKSEAFLHWMPVVNMPISLPVKALYGASDIVRVKLLEKKCLTLWCWWTAMCTMQNKTTLSASLVYETLPDGGSGTGILNLVDGSFKIVLFYDKITASGQC